MLRWILVHHSELIANPGRRSDTAFEPDVIDHKRTYMEIRLPLAERIGGEIFPNSDDRITPWPDSSLAQSWDHFSPTS